MQNRLMLLASVIVAMLSAPAHSDWIEGSQEATLHGGVALPLAKAELNPGSQKEKITGTSLTVGGEYYYHVLPQIAFGLGIDYTNFGDRSSSSFVPQKETNAGAKTTSILALGKYSFTTEGHPIFPYVMGGLGLHVSNLKVDGTPVSGQTWSDTTTTEQRTLVDDSRAALALAVGAGADLPIGTHTFVGLEGRYTYLANVTYTPTRTGKAAGITEISSGQHAISILVKAGIQF